MLHEIGLDVGDEFPRQVSKEIEAAADVIVTLDAHDQMDILDGKQYRAWRLSDHHDGLDDYRALREELSSRVSEPADSILA